MQRRSFIAAAVSSLFARSGGPLRASLAWPAAAAWPAGVHLSRGASGVVEVYFPPGFYTFPSPIVVAGRTRIVGG